MLIGEAGRIYSDGKKFVIIQVDWGGAVRHAIVGDSLYLKGLMVEDRFDGVRSLSVDLQTSGRIRFLSGEAAEKAAAQLQSAWDLPVEELLKIAYQKMDARSSES
jgi:hypothetical protein